MQVASPQTFLMQQSKKGRVSLVTNPNAPDRAKGNRKDTSSCLWRQRVASIAGASSAVRALSVAWRLVGYLLLSGTAQ